MTRNDLTAERVREAFIYNPLTGIFTCRINRDRARIGNIAGCLAPHGYWKIGIDGLRFYAHQLVWLYVHGRLPTFQIDHIDGDRSNNRLANLRDVEHSINTQNQRRAKSNNRAHVLGVNRGGKSSYTARIGINGKTRHLGTYPTPEEAHAAYLAAKRKLHVGNTL